MGYKPKKRSPLDFLQQGNMSDKCSYEQIDFNSTGSLDWKGKNVLNRYSQNVKIMEYHVPGAAYLLILCTFGSLLVMATSLEFDKFLDAKTLAIQPFWRTVIGSPIYDWFLQLSEYEVELCITEWGLCQIYSPETMLWPVCGRSWVWLPSVTQYFFLCLTLVTNWNSIFLMLLLVDNILTGK